MPRSSAETPRPTQHPDALDLVLRGYAAFLKPLTPESYAEAIGYFERALALDPGFVAAEASLAGALAGRVLEGMTGTRAADLERAEALSEAANCRTRKNGRNLPMMDGIAHAIATCDRIERALTVAAGRTKHALVEMQIELQNMLDAINADRAARGVSPLDVTLPRPPQ